MPRAEVTVGTVQRFQVFRLVALHVILQRLHMYRREEAVSALQRQRQAMRGAAVTQQQVQPYRAEVSAATMFGHVTVNISLVHHEPG